MGLAAAEGLGDDLRWSQRWLMLWEDVGAKLRVAGLRGGEVRLEQGAVQGGVASRGCF